MKKTNIKTNVMRFCKTNIRILAMVLMTAGICVCVFPHISEHVQDWKRRQMLEEWENRLVLLEDIAVDMEKETEAGADISSDTASDFGASSDPEEAEQDGEMIAVLTIEAIDLSVPVLKDATAANLKCSVATIEPTGIPGEVGNFTVAGHNSRTFGRHFNRLDEVELGDLIEVEVRNATYRYMVDHIQVIEPEDVWILESDNQTARITLISCYYAEDRTVKRLAVQGTLAE